MKKELDFNTLNNDEIFEALSKYKNLDALAGVFGSIFANSEEPNSKIKRSFQNFVCESLSSFRKDFIGTTELYYFKNDIATIEMSAGLMAIAVQQMEERGVGDVLRNRVLLEGLRATFNIKSGAPSDPLGAAVLKIIESYGEYYENGVNGCFINMIMRLIGSNLVSGLRPDYTKFIEPKLDLIADFMPRMEPGFSIFTKKVINNSRYLIDDILNAKW